MTRLVDSLERVATVVELELDERRRERLERDAKEDPRPGIDREPETFRSAELLLLVPDVGPVLQDSFKEVPPTFYDRDGKDVIVRCPCGNVVDVGFGAIRRCHGCMRFYLNVTRVLASPEPEPDELAYCDDCSADLPVREGTWIRTDDGRELFVCDRCIREIPDDLELDLLNEPELRQEAA